MKHAYHQSGQWDNYPSMWGCVLYVRESLKFEGVTMTVMVPHQYFQLGNCVGHAVQLNPGNIIFVSCQSISRVSHQSSQCFAIMAV